MTIVCIIETQWRRLFAMHCGRLAFTYCEIGDKMSCFVRSRHGPVHFGMQITRLASQQQQQPRQQQVGCHVVMNLRR
jgi:hypothetical protein